MSASHAIIGLRELRENMARYLEHVGKGKSFTVVRRSKPIFKITPIDDDDESLWQTVVDFTKIRPGGVSAESVLKSLRKLRTNGAR